MIRIIVFILLLVTSVSFAQKRPYTKHETHFKGTDYELNIYKIYGRNDGKTMFIEAINGATLAFPMETLCR